MTSTVVCGYTGADWEVNSSGQNACQVYAALAGQCNSGFTISSATSSSPPYAPQNNACTCNLVAYNLQAACGWCQSTIQSSWWLTEAEWAGNCTTSSYNSAGVPSSVTTSTINIPNWAFLHNIGDSWSPSQASAAAVSGGINTPIATGNGNNNGFSYSYNPYTYTGYNSNPYYWDAYYGAGVAAYLVVVGVIFGLYALMGIIMGVVYYIRQKRRKAWYGPMAQYYRQAGVGGYQGNYASGGQYQPPVYNNNRGSMHPGYNPNPSAAGAPLLYNNEPNVHGSPKTLGSSLYSSGTPQPYQPPPPGTNPFNTPYPTPGAEQSQYQPPPNAHNSMYGAPPQGPPPGAQGAYKGHAEVY